MVRANYLPAPHFFNLTQACRILLAAFNDSYGIFLVGSCLKTRDYRDVDLRCIMPDEAFDQLFPGCGETPHYHARWSVMCSTISLWLSKHTDLPIDFQIQRASQANKEYPSVQHKRSALGYFVCPADPPNPTDDAAEDEEG